MLFGPLSGLEMRSTRVEGASIVAEMIISVNLTAQPIERVRCASLYALLSEHPIPVRMYLQSTCPLCLSGSAKFRTAFLELLQTIIDNVKYGGAPAHALEPLRQLKASSEKRNHSWFSNAANFEEAVIGCARAITASF